MSFNLSSSSCVLVPGWANWPLYYELRLDKTHHMTSRFIPEATANVWMCGATPTFEWCFDWFECVKSCLEAVPWYHCLTTPTFEYCTTRSNKNKQFCCAAWSRLFCSVGIMIPLRKVEMNVKIDTGMLFILIESLLVHTERICIQRKSMRLKQTHSYGGSPCHGWEAERW